VPAPDAMAAQFDDLEGQLADFRAALRALALATTADDLRRIAARLRTPSTSIGAPPCPTATPSPTAMSRALGVPS
jgi:hypothetical protein